MNRRSLRLVEFVYWVLAVAGGLGAVSLVGGLLVGGDFVGVKVALFVVGFLVFGIGALGLRPKPPHKDEKRFDLDQLGATRVEQFIDDLPPLADAYLPLDERVGRATKLFVTGLVLLGVSMFMEFVLGVSVAA